MSDFWENEDGLTFETSIREYNLEEANGWTPDCSNKWDYDPSLISFSCRVWGPHEGFMTHRVGSEVRIEKPFDPSTTWMASVNCGGEDLFETGLMRSESLDAAKREVEAWVQEKAQFICAAVRAAVAERTHTARISENTGTTQSEPDTATATLDTPDAS